TSDPLTACACRAAGASSASTSTTKRRIGDLLMTCNAWRVGETLNTLRKTGDPCPLQRPGGLRLLQQVFHAAHALARRFFRRRRAVPVGFERERAGVAILLQ